MKEELSFKLEGKEWEQLQDEAFNKVNKNAKIAGFRPGKAPRNVYEKNYGKQEIFYEAADMAIKKEYDRIIKEDKIFPVIEPQIDLVKLEDKVLEVKFVFITDPKVTLGEYTNLGLKREKPKVSKEEIKERINRLLDEYAELREKDGAVAEGDIAVINYKGLKDGVAFEGGTSDNYELKIGSHTFIPGFEEGIIGMKKDEEKDIELTFPKDYMSEELKGQKVVFKVKVNEIKERIVPKLDKDFFEDLAMEGVTDEASLEKQIKEEINHQKEHELEDKYEELCLDKAASNMKVEMASELIDDESEHMYQDFLKKMQMQGITEEMYFGFLNTRREQLEKQIKDGKASKEEKDSLKDIPSSKEDIKKQMAPQAEKRLKYRYLLKEIIKKEKIKVTDTEVKNQVKEMAKMYNVDEKTITDEISLEDIRSELTYKKALEIVTTNKEEK